MEFKFEELRAEFDKLDTRLQIIAYALCGFVRYRFNKTVCVTHIFRTQAEQNDMYNHLKEYQDDPWQSVHQYFRGLDVRLWNYTKQELDQIMEFLNKKFEYSGKLKTAVMHDVGHGWHIHIQVDIDGITVIRDDDY